MTGETRNLICTVVLGAMSTSAAIGEELRSGTFYPLEKVPSELIARAPAGTPVRFALEENGTTGYRWEVDSNTNECEVVVEHRGAPVKGGLAGAPGRMSVAVTSKVQTPARVEFRYRRPWEKDVKPAKSVRFILYTAADKVASPLYPDTAVNRLLKKECEERGIVITDWHLHIRGGMTPEMAVEREKASGIRSSAMENHGREWEIFDNARLRAFAARARQANPKMPVGIQVNDRDWFREIDAETRAKFDYVLADTMIMGKLPDGRDNRLWMVKTVDDADAWMERYMAHNLQILDEPISILANPTYLPEPLAAEYDRLWTEERMRQLIAKAVERGIALEIQAGSPYPRPKFLKLAKEMGAKFSFGTNNFDPTPKDLSRWLEAITWLGLKGSDVWTPSAALGERYWRTKSEADRLAWVKALDREGHDFTKRYRPDYGPRGIYKFNRDSRIACFVITKKTAETLGKDAFDAKTADGPFHFEWTRQADGTLDYTYTAPTNWEVYVSAYGAKPRGNPKPEANISFWTSFPQRGVTTLGVAHHRADWKAGPYADYPFPTNEIKAADNFIFAVREALPLIGFDRPETLDGSVGLGTFDSNFPKGHMDFPPHFHVIPGCRDGQQVHHFYVRREDGRVTSDCYQDMSNVIDVWDRAVTFVPGDEFPCYDGKGRVAFRVKMLDDGTGLELMTADRGKRVRVAGERPCDAVNVEAPEGEGWKTVRTITVTDDPYAGVMETPEGTVRYDPASGKRLAGEN